jgi:hypothetical protein
MVFKKKPENDPVDRTKCRPPGGQPGVKWLSFGDGIIGLNRKDFDHFLLYIADDFAMEETEHYFSQSNHCKYLDRHTIFQFYSRNGLEYLTQQVSPMFKMCWDHQVKDGSIQILVDKDNKYMSDGIINNIKDVKYIDADIFKDFSQEDKVRQVRDDAKNDYARMFWTKDYEKQWRHRDENREETIIDSYGSNFIEIDEERSAVRIRRMYPIEFAIKYGRLEYYKEAIMATLYCLMKILNDMSKDAAEKATKSAATAEKAAKYAAKKTAEVEDWKTAAAKAQVKAEARKAEKDAAKFAATAAENAAAKEATKDAAEQISKFPNDMREGGVMSITTDDWDKFKVKKQEEEETELNAKVEAFRKSQQKGGKRRNSRKTMKSKTAKKSNKSKRKSRKYHRK